MKKIWLFLLFSLLFSACLLIKSTSPTPLNKPKWTEVNTNQQEHKTLNSPSAPILTGNSKEAREQAIENHLLTSEKERYFYSPGSHFFCEVRIMREYTVNATEKIVYALNRCAHVLKLDWDLRSDGAGWGPRFFKMQYHNEQRQVTEKDNRILGPKEPNTQDRVAFAEEKLPKHLKSEKCIDDNCFSTQGIIQKAADYFEVKLPEYKLNTCRLNKDCDADAICVLHGTHSNRWKNTCVKTCNTNRECGIAHACRYQCVKGENGCPDTAEKICTPDLLSAQVVKDPDHFVGFGDREIHMRRAIE